MYLMSSLSVEYWDFNVLLREGSSRGGAVQAAALVGTLTEATTALSTPHLWTTTTTTTMTTTLITNNRQVTLIRTTMVGA